jgi:nucleoside-diphosphate-sugar epimerase
MGIKPAILKMKNTRVLVIGGTGRLGSLVRRAVGDGRAAGVNLIWQARAEGRGGDVLLDPLSEPEAYADAARAADVVLNLAGAVSGEAPALADNTALALAAVRAAQAAGGRPVLIASSAAVYGPKPGAQSEVDTCFPAGGYGAAKLAMEREVSCAPGVCCLRIGNVAGADALLGVPHEPGTRMLDIFPDGTAPRRSYIGPRALAQALVQLARLAAGGADLPALLNLALSGPVGMDALLRAAGESWTDRPAPDGAIAEITLDVSRAIALGIVPEDPARASEIVADLASLRGEATA